MTKKLLSSFVFLVAAFLFVATTSSFSLITPVFADAGAGGGGCNDDNSNEDGSCVNPDASSSQKKGNEKDNIDEEADDSIPSFNYDEDGGNAGSKTKDFAEYFVSYAELHHQKDMLSDVHRMDSYYNAIMNNKAAAFKDKVVLDVGTGSGILAIWAAKAGAKKVYAIEYTDMAHNARRLIKANNLDHIITVIQGTVESINLPLKEDGLISDDNERVVDVIVSEWMGYMLLRESMLDSVLVARDRYLRKDTGLMFPSHGKIYIAPIKDERSRLESLHDYNNAMEDWHGFVESIQEHYDVDFDTLSDNFEKEQGDYYVHTGQWKELNAQNLLWKSDTIADNNDSNKPYQVIKELDFFTCTLKDTRGIFGVADNGNGNIDRGRFDFVINPNKVTGAISGFASWFTTDFKSRTDPIGKVHAPKLTGGKTQKESLQTKNPSHHITLNTGPEQGYTHWGQQVFYLKEPIRIKNDLKVASKGKDTPPANSVKVHLKGTVDMQRTKDNTRLYNVRIAYHLEEIYNKDTPPDSKISRRTDTTDIVYKIQ